MNYTFSNPVFQYLFLTFGILTLGACQKQPNEVRLAQQYIETPAFMAQGYENHICATETNINGYVNIHSYSTMGVAGAVNARCSAMFFDQNGPTDRGVLSVGATDYSVANTSSLLYDGTVSNEVGESWFDHSKIIKLKDGAATIFEDNFKFPKAINITSPTFGEDFLPINTSNKVIQWNADSSNDLGISIIFKYRPPISTSASVDASGGYSANEIINHTYLSNDNGTYELQASDFQNIPIGATVHILLNRGTCNIVENTMGEKFRLVGLSSILGVFKYEGL